MVYELYISNSASSHPYPPTNSSHELSRRQNGARRDRIRAFEALLLGDTIVGLIHTIPTRGGTSRESSWAMSYTRGSTHLGYLGRIFISAPMTPKWPLLTPNSTKLSAVFTHGLCLTLSISTCRVRDFESALCHVCMPKQASACPGSVTQAQPENLQLPSEDKIHSHHISDPSAKFHMKS